MQLLYKLRSLCFKRETVFFYLGYNRKTEKNNFPEGPIKCLILCDQLMITTMKQKGSGLQGSFRSKKIFYGLWL